MSVARSFWALVEERAAATPRAPMLVDERGRTLTFGGFRDGAEQVAAGLFALGVGEGSCVSWQLPTTMESVVLTAALARLGAVQNPIIASLREREVRLIVEQCRPALLVVPPVWRGFEHEAMARSAAHGTDTDVLVVDVSTPAAGGSALGALPVGDPATLPAWSEDPTAVRTAVRWIFYSSGTTDVPKGVKHADVALLAAGENLRTGTDLRPDDLYPLAYPFAHIGGPAFLCAQLRAGARVQLLDRFDPGTSPALMAAAGATVLGSGLPFIAAYLAAQGEAPQPMFPALRICAAGGAPTPPELHQQVKDKLGGRGVSSAYGLTEFPVATCVGADDGDEVMAHTVGRPGFGVQVRVVDSAGQDLAPGVEGEILLRGPQRFLGYVDPRLDAQALDPEGYFRTGDLGTVDERGLVRITGRLKDVIIRNGENVSAAEVEQALLQHPDIDDAAVIGVPDRITGERVLAFVQPAAGAETTLSTLAEACRGAGLAVYKTPEAFRVIEMVPRNSLGKILKTELRAIVLPVPASAE